MPPLPPGPGAVIVASAPVAPAASLRAATAFAATSTTAAATGTAGDGPTTGGNEPPTPPLPDGATPPAPTPAPTPGPTPSPTPTPSPAPEPEPGRLSTATVAADAAPLLGAEGAAALQARVAGSATVSAGTRWVVRPGVEVRSSGTLTLTEDWALPSAPADAVVAPGAVEVGGLALTLRAAGSLWLQGSLGAGFVAALDGDAASRWLPADARAGDIRLQAGADIVVGRDADAGRVDRPEVLLRSTTGAISAVAGGDIRLAHEGAAIYTTGVALRPDGSPLSDFAGQLLGFVETADGTLSPYLAGGGRVSLEAGGQVTGVVASSALPTDWAWRGSDGSATYRWSRFDRFTGGVASFGGGDVAVRAGGDIVDLAVAAADSGWLGADGSAGTLGAGTLALDAGGSLLGGNAWAAGSALAIRVAGRIGAVDDVGLAPDLVWQGTALTLAAGGDIDLARVQSSGRAASSQANLAGDLIVMDGLDTGATLRATSVHGSITLRGQGQTGRLGESTTYGNLPSTLPGDALIAAPEGDVALQGQLAQSVGRSAQLTVLAGGDLSVGSLTVPAGGVDRAPQARPLADVLAELPIAAFAIVDGGALALDATDRTPVQLAARDGDLRLSGVLQSARPLRATAGRDLAIDGAAQIVVQHQPQRLDGDAPQPASELTLLQAGRDLTAAGASSALAGITLAGPGDLALLAGRDIDLGASRGVQAVGNQRNSTLLPEGAVQVTALAGLAAAGGVGAIVDASGGAYPVSGVLALSGALVRDPVTGRLVADGQAVALWAFLAGEDGDAFASMSTPQQIAAMRARFGTDFDGWLAQWMRQAFALAAAPDAAAAQAGVLAARLDGNALAARVQADLAAVPAAERPARAMAWLVDDGVRKDLVLGAWLRATLSATLDAGNAGATLDTLVAAGDVRAASAVGGVLARAFAAEPAARQAEYVAARWSALQADEGERLADWLASRLFDANGAIADDALAVRMREALGQNAEQGFASESAFRAAWDVLDPAAQRAALPAADLRLWAANPTQALLERGRGLDAYLARVGAAVDGSGPDAALAAFRALPPERQLPWLAEVLRGDLVAAGEAAAASAAGAPFDAAYATGYASLGALFPAVGTAGNAASGGDLVLPTSQIRSAQAGGITLLTPAGGINAGALVPGAVAKKANELGIVTVAGGAITAAVRDDFQVNQSRVFTLAAGDIVLWASEGNVDAGRGAKTVTGAPAPVLRLDADGNLVVDTSGSFSGSGIAALDAGSNVGLFAPRGEVNAGEAGIRSAGNLTVAAAQVRGADNIAVGGQTRGDTGVAAVATTAALSTAGQSAAAAAAAAAAPATQGDGDRSQRRRRHLFLDFLGFGSGDE